LGGFHQLDRRPVDTTAHWLAQNTDQRIVWVRIFWRATTRTVVNVTWYGSLVHKHLVLAHVAANTAARGALHGVVEANNRQPSIRLIRIGAAVTDLDGEVMVWSAAGASATARLFLSDVHGLVLLVENHVMVGRLAAAVGYRFHPIDALLDQELIGDVEPVPTLRSARRELLALDGPIAIFEHGT